jgi:hypothetical protein
VDQASAQLSVRRRGWLRALPDDQAEVLPDDRGEREHAQRGDQEKE